MKRAFTITEIIVVISIIVVLSGLVMVMSGKARTQAMISSTQQEMAFLEQTMNAYYEDMFRYPIEDGIDSNKSGNWNLVEHFTATHTGKGTWHGPYYEFKDDRLVDVGKGYKEFVDLWGNPYEYHTKNLRGIWSMNNSSYDLYSFGPNKIDDTGAGDDINNW